MKKIYLITALGLMMFTSNAQQTRKGNLQTTTGTSSFIKNGNQQVSVIVCDTVASYTAQDSLFLYTVGSANGGGYMAGNNGYGDLRKANFTDATLIPAGATITGVYAVMYKNTNGNGTKGTGAVSVTILNGDTTTGPSGAALATSATTMATVISGGTVVGNSLLYLFNFGTAITAPTTGFFSCMNLPTTTGDTVALYVTRNMASNQTHNYAWEEWTPSGWHSFGDPTNWNFKTSLSLYPVLCYNSTGIHNNVLEASMAMYPNPGNGQFNMVISLPEATTLNVNVTNALGQVVFTKTEKEFKAGILNYDLTSLGKGVYTILLTDSNNNKVVKKLIIE